MKMADHERNISEKDAFSRMARICSVKECCNYDIRQKLLKMSCPGNVAESVIARLKKENYIDEDRFARSFIHDKLRFNKWGRAKIEMALRQKQLPPEIIGQAFSEFTDELFDKSLQPLLEKKWKTIKGQSDYEKNGKLIRFALGRGFSMKEIRRCMENMNLTDFPDEA